MNISNNFAGRTAVIATMHGKETIIAPLLQQLGIECRVLPEFDTDRFGTFTRERARPHNQLETAKLKARSVLEGCDHTLAIASEGSFFPHPLLPMLPCNREVVMLYDRGQEVYFWGESVSTETNFNHCEAKNWEEVWQFAQKVGFPDHGLVVIGPEIVKGIRDWQSLPEIVNRALVNQPIVHIETDMRAMHNPTRQKNIAHATANLIDRLLSCCPACGAPGFDVTYRQPGLPCSWCGLPTQQIKILVYGCQFCEFKHQKSVEEQTADPQFCQFCNP